MSEKTVMDDLPKRFREIFKRNSAVVARAPGRVNLIGEHTDYNEGFVLPAAIERATYMAAAPRKDRKVRLVAIDLNRETSFDLDAIGISQEEPWSNYIRGVAAGLVQAKYPVQGMDAVIHSEIPIASGLSSSAALEMAAIWAFRATGHFDIPSEQAARIGQRAEHEFVGTRTGLMDQLASALGQQDHTLFIDCRDLKCQAVPIPKGATILIADTAASRELAFSAYNERRSQCETAAAAMGVPWLRDATIEKLEAAAMDEIVARRARHIIEENQRVNETVSALREGNLQRVGLLMDSSHVSMRDLYGISSRELDTMVELLRSQKGCCGARLTGAGFGGCAVALMKSDAVKAAIPVVAAAYESRTGLKPSLYPTRAAAGAGVLPVK